MEACSNYLAYSIRMNDIDSYLPGMDYFIYFYLPTWNMSQLFPFEHKGKAAGKKQRETEVS